MSRPGGVRRRSAEIVADMRRRSEVALDAARLAESSDSLDRECGARYVRLCITRTGTGEARVIAQVWQDGAIEVQASWGLDAEHVGRRVLWALEGLPRGGK